MSHPSTDTPAHDTDPSAAGSKRKPHSAFMLLGMTAGLGVILVLLLMVFIMPLLKSGAHDLSVGLAGTPAVVDDFEQALVTAAPDAYAPQRYDSEQDLRDAILDREIVGGFVVEDSGVHALVTSAGSATISGTLAGTANAIGQVTDSAVTVEDVVPLPPSDPTGVGIGGLAFPLVFGGIVPVVAFRKILPRSNGWYLAGLFTFAVVGGTIVAAVLTYAFGSVDTGFWAVAASVAMGIAALAFPLAGLQKLFGAKGFTIGAMAMMFLGNPLAGISTTSAWLPTGLGAFGQILPPGAAGTLVRSAAYFQGAGGLVAACTLAVWIVVGLALYAVGMRRAGLGTPKTAAPVPAT
ncbi:hypothetical protein [Rhodococcus coprophilus]|uniref:Hypothetical membrane protein n=1 Tax=Rhodococcus coprophilus TaxID=38310 RepID=A0A2X4U5C6_9NOCA|nr:hypothetical protein [Rhodococcus coprophilus]MBM7457756.1 hypothetical protein [Rhodococcus coprophilus]SQI30378.1 hypothetical membrane protein [Rhodococcus coprophilus]